MKRLLTLTVLVFLSLAIAQSGTLQYNSNASDPLPNEVDEMLVQLFMETYPDVTVEHTQVDHEGFKQAIRTYFASSRPPEVLTWFAGNRMRFFADRDALLNLDDLWEENNWGEVYPKGFQASSQHAGEFVFVPTQYYWWAVYYRKDIFGDLGLSEPQTWPELLEVCRALRANDIIPFTIGTRFLWPAAGWFDYLNMRVNGPEFHIDLTEGKVAYNSEEVKNTFNHWDQALDAGCFIENPAAYNWQEGADFFIQGDAAMYLIGDFVRDLYPDDREEAELDFFRFPIIDPSLPVGEEAPTDGYFASANADDPELAKLFLGFLGSKEAQELVAREMGRIVPRNDVDPSLYPEYVQKGLNEIINKADFIAQFYDRDTTPEMAQAGMNGFVEFMANPDQLDRILDQLENERARLFDN
jgi:multiple sugar transport system substrate-binding protein/raffinose/stachyose/melibiose transport system substrate-binding protein